MKICATVLAALAVFATGWAFPSLPSAGSETADDRKMMLNLLYKRIYGDSETPYEKRVSQQVADQAGVFNLCAKDRPFPCKKVKECISLSEVCDGHEDCADGWDEEESVCTAYNRVPYETIMDLFKSERWILKSFFRSTVRSNEDLSQLVHNLSMSPKLVDFQQKQKLTPEELARFKAFLVAIKDQDRQSMSDLGINSYNRRPVEGVFNGIIASGFI